jgi:hypothetical protein
MPLRNNTAPPVALDRLVQRLDALVTLGVPVPVRIAGLKKLATMGEIGERIFRKCVEVIEVTNKKRQYWPLMDLLMVERAIAEQCFPAAESTVPEHMRNAPEWLTESETILQLNVNMEATRGLKNEHE